MVTVTSVRVQKQVQIPASVLRPQLPEKELEVDSRKTGPGKQASMPSSQVQGSKDHALRIATLKLDGIRQAARTPGRPQWRKQENVRLVLGQQNVAGAQLRYCPANQPLFFASLGSGASS
jgi:hypothetical protein